MRGAHGAVDRRLSLEIIPMAVLQNVASGHVAVILAVFGNGHPVLALLRNLARWSFERHRLTGQCHMARPGSVTQQDLPVPGCKTGQCHICKALALLQATQHDKGFVDGWLLCHSLT